MTAENDLLAQHVETAVADRPQPAAASSLDVPMDAIVYEVHPACLTRQAIQTEYNSDYPYGPPSSALPPPNSELPGLLRVAHDAATWLVRTSESYFSALQSPPDFVVPKTFGM